MKTVFIKFKDDEDKNIFIISNTKSIHEDRSNIYAVGIISIYDKQKIHPIKMSTLEKLIEEGLISIVTTEEVKKSFFKSKTFNYNEYIKKYENQIENNEKRCIMCKFFNGGDCPIIKQNTLQSCKNAIIDDIYILNIGSLNINDTLPHYVQCTDKYSRDIFVIQQQLDYSYKSQVVKGTSLWSMESLSSNNRKEHYSYQAKKDILDRLMGKDLVCLDEKEANRIRKSLYLNGEDRFEQTTYVQLISDYSKDIFEVSRVTEGNTKKGEIIKWEIKSIYNSNSWRRQYEKTELENKLNRLNFKVLTAHEVKNNNYRDLISIPKIKEMFEYKFPPKFYLFRFKDNQSDILMLPIDSEMVSSLLELNLYGKSKEEHMGKEEFLVLREDLEPISAKNLVKIELGQSYKTASIKEKFMKKCLGEVDIASPSYCTVYGGPTVRLEIIDEIVKEDHGYFKCYSGGNEGGWQEDIKFVTKYYYRDHKQTKYELRSPEGGLEEFFEFLISNEYYPENASKYYMEVIEQRKALKQKPVVLIPDDDDDELPF